MIWVWIGIAAVLVAAGALVPVLLGRNTRLRSNDEAVAARSRYHQLGHYLDDGPEHVDHEEAQLLLRRARERWNSAGATLAKASTEADFELAEHVATEGLTAVADAYKLLDRPGPKLPGTTKRKKR